MPASHFVRRLAVNGIDDDATATETLLNCVDLLVGSGATAADILEDFTAHNPTVMHLMFYLALLRVKPSLAMAAPVFGALQACRRTLTTASYLSVLELIADPEDWGTADGLPTPWQGPATRKAIKWQEDLPDLVNTSRATEDLLRIASEQLLPQFDQAVLLLPCTGTEIDTKYYSGVNDVRLSSSAAIRRRDGVLFVHKTCNPQYVLDLVNAFQTDPTFEVGRPKIVLVQETVYGDTKSLVNGVYHA